MKKIVGLTIILVMMCCLSACDNNTNTETSKDENTNISSESNNTFDVQEDVKIVKNKNGKYETPEGKEYSYYLTLSGTMPSAEKSSTWVVYTNDKNLTFEKASKGLYSSNSNDGVDMYMVSWK